MRYLAIFFTTLIFSFTNFTPASAQTFAPPDDGGFGGGFDNPITGGFDTWDASAPTKEEWEEICGYTWECNWAWEDPEVMEQMLNSPGFYGFGTGGSMITIEGNLEDITILCEDMEITVGEGFSGCSISSEGTSVEIVIDTDNIWEAIQGLFDRCGDCTLTGGPSWFIYIGPVPPSGPLDIGPH